MVGVRTKGQRRNLSAMGWWLACVIGFIVLGGVFSQLASANSVVTIVMQDGAVVHDDDILLGEIAVFEGANPSLAEELAGVVVGRAPMPGLTRHLSPGHVEVRLRRAGFSLQGLKITTNTEQERIVVYRSDPPVAPETEELAPGPEQPLADVPKPEELVEVWVLVEDVGRGAPLRTDLLAPATVSPRRFVGRAVTDPQTVEGMRATRFLRSGKVLTEGDLEPIPPIVEGQRVTIVASGDGIRITAVGLALEDGDWGEVIPVRNVQSDRVIFATVTGLGVVSVRLFP